MADPVLSWGGLLAFAGYVGTAAGVLLYDLWLYLSGRATITQWAVRDRRRVLAVLGAAGAGAVVGLAGLVAHFVWY